MAVDFSVGSRGPRAPEPETALGGSVTEATRVKRALIRSPSRVERREGNYEFGEYKRQIFMKVKILMKEVRLGIDTRMESGEYDNL